MTVRRNDQCTLYLRSNNTLREEEQPLINFFVKNLKEGDVFYDIGANYGFYSVMALNLIKGGEIHAFEPSASTFKYLAKNISENETNANLTFVSQVAVGEKMGNIPFHDSYSEGNSSISTASPLGAGGDPIEANTTVYCTTIDMYTKNKKGPSFIKLDVEGYERNVIEGASSTISKYKPVIGMEIWKQESEKLPLLLINNFGYSMYQPDKTGDLKKVNANNISDYINGNYANFVFV